MGKFERFGSQQSSKLGGFGQGNYVRQLPPAITPVTYNDFWGGFDSRKSRDGTPDNASFDEIDIEITDKGRLTAMPGTTLVSALAGHPTVQMTMQSAFGRWAELLFFAPPFLGVFGASGLAWTDIGMPVTGQQVRYAFYGDKIIFFNGRNDPYVRQIGAAAVAVPEVPAGNAYASFAGRVFVGGAVIDGQYQPMGMIWSSVSGNPTDFVGAGANPELLIDESISGDRIVALKTMGLGMMAILCRRSIWVGTFTGDLERPADLQSRIAGAGCVSAETAKATPAGVVYLAEDGVRLFDGNQSTVISPTINGELLPLDRTKYLQYSATYDPIRNKYILLTPTESWHLDLEKKHWLRSSMIASSGTLFSTQLAGTAWAALAGDWNAYNDTAWIDLDNREVDDGELHFIHTIAGATSLHKLDRASSTYFGAARIPRWCTPLKRGKNLSGVVQLQNILVETLCDSVSQLQFSVPDINGDFTVVRTDDFNINAQLRERRLPCLHHGLGAAVKLEILSGEVEVSQFQAEWAPSGPRIELHPPEIGEILPPSMKAGTTQNLTINGLYFFPGTTVQISGVDVVVTNTVIVNPRQITVTFTAPRAAVVSTRDVTVTNTGGTSAPFPFDVTAADMAGIDLRLWLEADYGVQVAAGQSVTDALPWLDRSEYGNHVVPPAHLVGPIYRANGWPVGNKPYMEFNLNHGLQTAYAAALALGPFKVFMVWNQDATQGNASFYNALTDENIAEGIQQAAASVYVSRWNAGHTQLLESSRHTPFGWIPKGVRQLVRHEFNGTHASNRVFLNGVLTAVADQFILNPGVDAPHDTQFRIGWRDVALPAMQMKGTLVAFIVTPFAADSAVVEAYLQKWMV